ncbi:LysR family transcriptional regulator [Streptomyces sp. CA-111067]|uniref:LysR family transcriptional regulator n=1 Tax=Streptomyces sp. CA-111067 TaxID=3240046 RepID=UPI003D96D570
MLERRELDAFLTLAEELHFGRTAERLHVSTARVSQIVATLERRLGVRLFNRTSRRVELSAAGRRLYEEVHPAWQQITAAVERAVAAGRGLTGTLRIAFVGAAGGQLLAGAGALFRQRHPECEVLLREAQLTEIADRLRDGTADVGLDTFPAGDADLAQGPVLITEARMLAVPHGHPFARRTAVGVEDLARAPMIQLPDDLPPARRAARTPHATPAGRPIPPGPAASTLNEILTLVGAGHGVFPVGAHTRRYYARPDVGYVPFSDAPPLEWGLLWRADNATERVRAFTAAARDLLRDR